MKSKISGLAVATALLLLLPLSVPAANAASTPNVMYMVGTITGNVNGLPVDSDIHIKMDMKTGEETAEVSRMDPKLGAILRQVTAIVTVAGATGGATPQGGQNLFQLSNGNFVNSATMYWPKSKDKLELIHTITYTGGDTMNVSATINGTVPAITLRDEVKYKDFTEVMYWSDGTGAATDTGSKRAITTGVGFQGDFSKAKFRSYSVGASLLMETGKGSTTEYTGPQPAGPVLRTGKDITTTYDAATRTMHVHLFNILTPIESAPGN